MRVSKKRTIIGMLSAAALAGSATTAVSVAADHGQHGRGNPGHHHAATILTTTLAPSVPTDPSLHGVAPGGAPWVLREGDAQLGRDGALRVRIRGLVIPRPPGHGTPGPVMTVTASLYCGNDTTAAGTTPSVPISLSGNGRIHARLNLPSTCLAPVVLVHPNGIAAVYIAASGFSR